MSVNLHPPHKLAWWFAASVIVALSACGVVPADTSFDSLSGSIVQGDQAPLTPGSVVIVRLEDLSRHDGRVDILAEQRIEQPARLPINFRLKYDGGEIDPEHRYVVTASVYAGAQVIYVTHLPQNVITDGSSRRINLVLERIVVPHAQYISE